MKEWTREELQRFLEVRQELFLDPNGSNKERLIEATLMLQRALFDWYLAPPGTFEGLRSLIPTVAAQWSNLRDDERRTLHLRRFTLNSATPELPAVEGSVSEHQWQRIRGSLGLGLTEPGSIDRFLIQLDEETNPSLRINHRYLGELLPHDNMISYLSSVTATFLNENAIIGKVSPCVTHMEQAAVSWLVTLVGWDAGITAVAGATQLPIQRLPTLAPPSQRYLTWAREEPTGAVVAGGTIANISAMLIARNAVFDYLLGWPGAVQWLGPMTAWQLISRIHHFDRLVVVTSVGAHYSVEKAALQAGVARGNVVKLRGSVNPWILDGTAMDAWLTKAESAGSRGRSLVMAVVPIAGKTETGYVDRIEEIAAALDRHPSLLPTFPEVVWRLRDEKCADQIRRSISQLADRSSIPKADASFRASAASWSRDALKDDASDYSKLMRRIAKDQENEFQHAHHNRPFLHVDAAHGAAFLTIKAMDREFAGINLADSITVDGHKSFYCYYPCGGLLVRTTRWAKTFSTDAAYITEDGLPGSDREHSVVFARELPTVGTPAPPMPDALDLDQLAFDHKRRGLYETIRQLIGRPAAASRSELTHNPFTEYLEGSRGAQGILQLYFNLASLGLTGYRSLLEWTVLLRERLEEAVSLGMTDLRLVTDPLIADVLQGETTATERSPESGDTLVAINAADKRLAFLTGGGGRLSVDDDVPREDRMRVPLAGGRFLRLSAGACNQVLISYVPTRESKLIATQPAEYWQERIGRGERPRILPTMRYLWRVNEHLWHEHLYANPHFTYYVGHTKLLLEPPNDPPGTEDARPDPLGALLTGWNAWTRQGNGRCPFFDVLAEWLGKVDLGGKPTYPDYGRYFFCHKVIVMHPYTDESLLGDMLRRVAFWGERSVLDVADADMRARFLFPDSPGGNVHPAAGPQPQETE